MKKYIAIPIMLLTLSATTAFSAITATVKDLTLSREGDNIRLTATVDFKNGAALISTQEFTVSESVAVYMGKHKYTAARFKQLLMSYLKQQINGRKKAIMVDSGVSTTWKTDLQAEIDK